MTPPIAHYRNGGYEVSIFADGTKVRIQHTDEPPLHVEQLDLKATDFCDLACPWCHEQSTRRGRHGDVGAMLQLLAGLPPGVEIAIGGGDPLSHPEFERLALGLRDLGLIVNVTVNGRHLAGHLPMLTKLIDLGALRGVGVSASGSLPDWDYEHAVIHLIAGVDDPAILDDQPRRKLLLLGYKTHGRGARYRSRPAHKVEENIARWRRELLWIAQEHHLSFDTLAIEQLEPRRLFKDQETFERRFMGREGAFSMYVDGVTRTYAISSYSPDRRDWTDVNAMSADVRIRGAAQ